MVILLTLISLHDGYVTCFNIGLHDRYFANYNVGLYHRSLDLFNLHVHLYGNNYSIGLMH